MAKNRNNTGNTQTKERLPNSIKSTGNTQSIIITNRKNEINAAKETSSLMTQLNDKSYHTDFFNHLNAKNIAKEVGTDPLLWFVLVLTIAGGYYLTLGVNVSFAFLILMPFCILGLGFGATMLSVTFRKNFKKMVSGDDIRNFFEESNSIYKNYSSSVIKRVILCLKYDSDGESENIKSFSILTPFSVLFLASMFLEDDFKRWMAVPIALLSFTISIYAFNRTRNLLFEKYKISLLERAELLHNENNKI